MSTRGKGLGVTMVSIRDHIHDGRAVCGIQSPGLSTQSV
jgi:hypothetical protein